MKILEIMVSFDPGEGYGVARYAAGLSRGLSDLGHQVTLLSMGRSEGLEEERHGVRIRHLATPYPFHAYNDSLQSVLENVALGVELAELWEQGGPFDVVLCHDWAGGLVGGTAQRVFHAPLVSILHGCQVGRTGGQGSAEELFVADMERWLCERSDRVVVESDHVRKEVCTNYRIPPHKVISVPGCIDARGFESEVDREEFRSVFAEPDESIVLFAGRLVPAKGPDLFLDTVARLRKKAPRVRCVMAGDGPMRDELAKGAEQLGLASHVRFTGHLGPLVLGALYQVADVLLVSSRYESLGVAVLEAVLHGLPVVASKAAGLVELTGDLRKAQVDGVDLDPERLAAAVLAAIKRRENRPKSTAPEAGRIPLKYRIESSVKSFQHLCETLCRAAPVVAT